MEDRDRYWEDKKQRVRDKESRIKRGMDEQMRVREELGGKMGRLGLKQGEVQELGRLLRRKIEEYRCRLHGVREERARLKEGRWAEAREGDRERVREEEREVDKLRARVEKGERKVEEMGREVEKTEGAVKGMEERLSKQTEELEGNN